MVGQAMARHSQRKRKNTAVAVAVVATAAASGALSTVFSGQRAQKRSFEGRRVSPVSSLSVAPAVDCPTAAGLPLLASRDAAFAVGGGQQQSLPDEGDIQLKETLQEAVEDIHSRIRSREPQTLSVNHEMPPFIPKKVWTHLGNLLKEREHLGAQLPTDAWVTLRLDGCAWGTMLGRLKDTGVLPPGFSDVIGEAMRDTLRAVMTEFGGVMGYTHSDEFTVVIPPGPRVYDGSAQKWHSVSASVAAAEFNRQLAMIAAERGVEVEENLAAFFDARAGVFDNADQVTALVLWRAYDCTINAASDAIKFSGAPMLVRTLNTIEKLKFLEECDMLPLPRHQAYGSLLIRSPGAEGDDGPTFALANDGANDTARHLFNVLKLGPLLPDGGVVGAASAALHQ